MEEVGKVDRTKNEKIYLKIEERMARLYPSSYAYDIILTVILVALFVLSLINISPTVSLLTTVVSQIGTAWLVHSQLHSHDRWVSKSGKVVLNVCSCWAEWYWDCREGGGRRGTWPITSSPTTIPRTDMVDAEGYYFPPSS